jgi:Tol biopolymer transport system component
VVEPVGNLNVLGSYSVSANGALAYFRASSDTGSLVWVGRDGSTTPIASGLRGLRNPRLSPDGRVLAAVVAGDLWAYDVRGRPPIRLTSGGEYFTPLFTRDGTRVVFEGNEEPRQLFSVPADGSGGAPSRVGPPGHFHPHGWSLDGMEIIASRLPGQPNSGPSTDLVRFATSENAQIQPVVDTPAAEGPASVSPDGRWIAYASDSTGTTEIWVRPFPGPGAPIRVSPSGGSEPVWSKNGRELYYLQGTNMMAVAVDAGAAFNFMPPTRVLDATTLERGTQAPNYDVAADGRFVFVKADAQSNQSVSVILNWQELLRQKPAH